MLTKNRDRSVKKLLFGTATYINEYWNSSDRQPLLKQLHVHKEQTPLHCIANLIVQYHPQKHLAILPPICLVAFLLPNNGSKWTSRLCVEAQSINVRAIHVIPKWNTCTRSCVAWNLRTNKSSCIILLPRVGRFNVGISTINYKGTEKQLLINNPSTFNALQEWEMGIPAINFDKFSFSNYITWTNFCHSSLLTLI